MARWVAVCRKREIGAGWRVDGRREMEMRDLEYVG